MLSNYISLSWIESQGSKSNLIFCKWKQCICLEKFAPESKTGECKWIDIFAARSLKFEGTNVESLIWVLTQNPKSIIERKVKFRGCHFIYGREVLVYKQHKNHKPSIRFRISSNDCFIFASLTTRLDFLKVQKALLVVWKYYSTLNYHKFWRTLFHFY